MSIQKFRFFAFFLVYFPAFIYGYQYAYYLGLTEFLGSDIAEIGLSSHEVLFSGFIFFIGLLFERLNTILNQLLIILCVLSLLLISIPILLYLGIHPSKRKSSIHFLKSEYVYLKSKYKPINDRFLNIILSSQFALLIFFFGFSLLNHSLNQGKKESIDNIQQLYAFQQRCEESANITEHECNFSSIKNVGVVTQNNHSYKVFKILCGSYKCVGLDIESNQNITFLPENYRKNFDIQEFIKIHKSSEEGNSKQHIDAVQQALSESFKE